jgi:hypothetical protein
MPTPSTTISLAKICEYLYTANGLKQGLFFNGQVDPRRNIQLYMERKAVEYGNSQNLDGIQGVSNYVYTLLGAELQKANEILESGSSGGIIVNPSTGVSTLVNYYEDYVIGDVDAPILDGETSYTIDIGMGRIWSANSMIVSRDQSLLPKDKSGYVTYNATYDTVTGLVTLTFSEAVATGQLYTVQFNYLIV